MWMTSEQPAQADALSKRLESDSGMATRRFGRVLSAGLDADGEAERSDLHSGVDDAPSPDRRSPARPGRVTHQGVQADVGLGWGWMQVRCDDAAAHRAVTQRVLLASHGTDRVQASLADASSHADPTIDDSQARPTAGRSVVGAILRYLDPLAETH